MNSFLFIIACVIFLMQNGFDDPNLFTGANDIIATRDNSGNLQATDFTVQFGKRDCLLPRSGMPVKIYVNDRIIDQTMTLDKFGKAYFTEKDTFPYSIWSAFMGLGDPAEEDKSVIASPELLESMNLSPGVNTIDYRIESHCGSASNTTANIYLLDHQTKVVVSDVDGTITRSDLRGILFPALKISDWKHQGICQFYRKISEQGYQFLYLTARPIGNSRKIKKYLAKIRDDEHGLPDGPVVMVGTSVVDAIYNDVIGRTIDVEKLEKIGQLKRIFFPNTPIYAAFGNTDTDMMAYKAIGIPHDRIFRIGKDSGIETLAMPHRFTIQELITAVPTTFPSITSKLS